MRRKAGSHAREVRRRRVSVDMFSNCARSGTNGSRRLFLVFDDAVLLCFAYVETLSALELLRQRHVGTSSTLQI